MDSKLDYRAQMSVLQEKMLQAGTDAGQLLDWAHGLRRARYRGLAKARLQNYLAGAACNIKRWIRRQPG